MKKLLAITMTTAVLFLFACGEPGTPEGQIRAAVKEFEAAMHEGDYNKVKNLLASDNTEIDEQSFKMMAAMMKTIKLEVLEVTVDGDTADVKMKTTLEFMGEMQTDESSVKFKLEGGKWKMANTIGGGEE